MRTLIVARHGESEYSAHGLMNGDPSVPVGLTRAGERQARVLADTLRDIPIDLCVTTELLRTRRTAELALAGRDVPVEVWGELNDPRAGAFEGGQLDDYRGWAWRSGSAEAVPGGGESRLEVVARCVRAYGALLERQERTVLAVGHALPIAYLLAAVEGTVPAARMNRPVEYARPYPVPAAALRRAVALLGDWCAAPDW